MFMFSQRTSNKTSLRFCRHVVRYKKRRTFYQEKSTALDRKKKQLLDNIYINASAASDKS